MAQDAPQEQLLQGGGLCNVQVRCDHGLRSPRDEVLVEQALLACSADSARITFRFSLADDWLSNANLSSFRLGFTLCANRAGLVMGCLMFGFCTLLRNVLVINQFCSPSNKLGFSIGELFGFIQPTEQKTSIKLLLREVC